MNVALARPESSDDHIRMDDGIVALSAMMSDVSDEDEILRLAGALISAWDPYRCSGQYLLCDGVLTRSPPDVPPDPGLDAQVEALDGVDGAVAVAGRAWGWAFGLHGFGRDRGYLVVSADAEAPADDLFRLRVVAQQVAAAVANAALRRGAREQQRQLDVLTDRLASVTRRLTAVVTELERQTAVHEALARGAAPGRGEQGIAEALYELTGLVVTVEDRFGNLRTWAGPQRPDGYPLSDSAGREDSLRQAASQGRPVRDHSRVMSAIQPSHDILGALALIDPERRVGPPEMFALEHATAAIALEFTHQRHVAEVELRLRRDLVDELVTGTDPASAFARAEAVGHDLHVAHHVAVLQWQGLADGDALATATSYVAGTLGMKMLLAKRAGVVVLLVAGTPPAGELYDLVSTRLGTTDGAIGVGGRCESPIDLPRSFNEASRALKIRQTTRSPNGVTVFDDLGIYRILGNGRGDEIERYVREWLGSLIDYDRIHHADLTNTLFQYLECGGNYDDAAGALIIHRSTLRYRLQRIRNITGFDLGDVNNRLNLHVAARAWHVLDATEGKGGA